MDDGTTSLLAQSESRVASHLERSKKWTSTVSWNGVLRDYVLVFSFGMFQEPLGRWEGKRERQRQADKQGIGNGNRKWEGLRLFFPTRPFGCYMAVFFLFPLSVSLAQIQQLNQTRSRAQDASSDASSEPGMWDF